MEPTVIIVSVISGATAIFSLVLSTLSWIRHNEKDLDHMLSEHNTELAVMKQRLEHLEKGCNCSRNCP